ncbi:acyl carrier protein [Hazenella sp. IB182357]|uniref:Acyl carrier protein n=1 Tax=Polycladospora coralii TaxID=2771432 RepID=A0A926NFN0_9BACL|nr:acyl carrier protein [Polycladospora coralii]MBD1372669.1 acyl carrier protein [Polycladospora coralii]MBS7531063.1 acyl carrier protein [Polycladospora coralii]
MNIENTIKKILSSELFVEVSEEEMGLDDSLRNDFSLDSMGFIELRVNCEEQFDIKISDEKFNDQNFKSIRTVADLVRELQMAKK